MLKRIPLDEIRGNPDQPRQHFGAREIGELADSIAENGLKQPITVRPAAGGYMIVMGERRFRAHLLLQERGLANDILCHVRRMDDETMHLEAIIENLQRVDVHPMEEAVAFGRMVDAFGYTPETLAKKLGRPVHRVVEKLGLLNLTADNRDIYRRGVLTNGHAYAMAKLAPHQQQELLEHIRAGRAAGYMQADKLADAILAREAQGALFSEAEAPEARRADEERMSRIEAAIERATEAVAKCFANGEITIAGQLDPGRFEKAAQSAALLRKHLYDIEAELKRAYNLAHLEAAA